MDSTEKTSASKYISLMLRHKPEAGGITLDEHGWADVNMIISAVKRKYPIDFDTEALEDIVKTDSKQRYSFNSDRTLIRANQGHSVPVDVELPQREPPELLFHGTGEKFAGAIDKQGLIPKSRLYVHLSKDRETAVNVGSRHGRPVVYTVKSGEMQRSGYSFYLSVNGVWLTKAVPPEFLERKQG